MCLRMSMWCSGITFGLAILLVNLTSGVPFRSPTLECSFADMHTVATWLRGKNMQTCDVFFLNLNYLINE